MTTALQDALFDCDWIPYEVFENDIAACRQGACSSASERYRVLIVPPVEVIPYATLAKARQFFEQGGVVVGLRFPAHASRRRWDASAPRSRRCARRSGERSRDRAVCRFAKTSPAGGRSYFLPEQPTVEQIQQVLDHATRGSTPTSRWSTADTNTGCTCSTA